MSKQAGTLYMVATPIGNMGDISQRAISALSKVDVVLCEDTRVTGKLLSMLAIATKTERCDENIIAARAPALVDRLLSGETMAFASDAGTPGISDPGSRLVAAAQDAGVPVVPIPGASAVTAALSASGFSTTAFYFGGFLPRKAGARDKLLASLAPLQAVLVFYESPHRLRATLEALAAAFPGREAAVAREITKLHEEIIRMDIEGLAEEFARRESGEEGVRGEAVILVGPPVEAAKTAPSEDELEAQADALLEEGISKRDAARRLADAAGISKGDAYDIVNGLGANKAR